MPTSQNTTYHLRNWSDYNRSLKHRGNITLWIDTSTLAAWREASGYRTYTDLAIEVCLRVRVVFGLPLRQTEGFLEGLALALSLDLQVPDYSTISRRSASLEVTVPHLPVVGPVHLAVDSTGLKIYGEGEWKVRMHGYGKRRTWVKLHLGVDEATGQILTHGVTGSDTHDDTVTPALLGKLTVPVAQVSADKAYDREGSRTAIAALGAVATVPVRADAVLALLSPADRGSPSFEAGNRRNLTLHATMRDGYRAWADSSGYTRRAAAEWTMSRVKRSFGNGLRSRKPERQQAEASIRVALLNEWFMNCRPESFPAG